MATSLTETVILVNVRRSSRKVSVIFPYSNEKVDHIKRSFKICTFWSDYIKKDELVGTCTH
jgi:hypothetical protein